MLVVRYLHIIRALNFQMFISCLYIVLSPIIYVFNDYCEL